MSYRQFSLLTVLGIWVLKCTCALSAEETFILTNGATGETVLELGPDINKQISPCSTFKMTLALIGYDAGVLKTEQIPTLDFQEGYDDFLECWKSPQTPRSFMKYSCVWYAKLLSLQLGLEKIKKYLGFFEYGNQDTSSGLARPGPETPLWINSSLKISPKQQVEFIQKMLQGELLVSIKAIQMTKSIAYKEQLSDGWQLFGKTGWSGSDIGKDGKTLEHGWFVGWIEKDYIFFPFAYLIRDHQINLDQRVPKVKQLLIEANVMNKK